MDGEGGGEVRWGDGRLRCALCAGEGDVAELHLPHGISVSLCADHRADRFLQLNGGADLADALSDLWQAAGCLTARRRAALAGHIRRMARSSPPARPKPGSYAWPQLRLEAERRFSAGEPPQRVIHELRRACGAGEAVAPSVRTMRRWHSEARWCLAPPPDASRRGADRVFEWVDGVRRHGEPYSWAVTGWPRTDRHGRPYRRR